LYSANPEKQQQWEAFKADFSGKCLASWDKMTGGPQKIIGENIELGTKAINQQNIAQFVSRFLKKYEALFNITCSWRSVVLLPPGYEI
jgi:hypothetical protein